MPSRVSRSASIDARWLATADFATALGSRLDGCPVLTPYGLFDAPEVAAWALRSGGVPSASRSVVRRLPSPLRSLSGDVRLWQQARSLRSLEPAFSNHHYDLVVQFHRRFQDLGLRIARSSGASFVLRLEALEVQEERAWGRTRPVFGSVVERRGELSLIREADLVLPVSSSLEQALLERGIAREKVVMMPNGVDLDLFSPGPADESLRREHGLEGRFVVGWIGGFRPFHGLELLRDVVEGLRTRIPNVTVCLIGTGPLRTELERDLQGSERWVRFVDAIPRSEVPRWIRTFDVCLLLAAGQAFHYSPLKLFEYLACGRPVVAANVGQVSEVLDGTDGGVLVPAGDAEAVASAVEELAGDARKRERMVVDARSVAAGTASWDARVNSLLRELGSRSLVPRRQAPSPGRLSVGDA